MSQNTNAVSSRIEHPLVARSNTVRHISGAALVAVALGASIFLAACGKNDPAVPAAAGTSAAPPAQAPVATQSGESSIAKMNAYTEAYNKIIGTFGLFETRDRYFKANIPSKKPSDSVSITVGWVDIALERFKKGRALPAGDLEQLDKAADGLIAPLEKLVAELKELDVYYTSKAYKDDGLAKGKAKDAEVRADFVASVAALKSFNEVLSAEQNKRDTAMLAKLKESGDMLGYSTKMALRQGEQLINLFDDQSDISNPAKYVQGDAIIASLEATLAEQRKAYADAKAKQPSPDSGHESAGSRLVSLIGNYREMKQSKKAQAYNSMVKDYNSAIESANRISR